MSTQIELLPKGALSEISGTLGSGKTELFLKYLAKQPPSNRIGWIEEQLTIYPCSFLQFGIDLEQVLFAEAAENSLWTATQMLRSRLFKTVAIISKKLDSVSLRRLQLDAEKSGTSVVLLQNTPTLEGAWPIACQIHIQRRQVTVLKNKNKIASTEKLLRMGVQF